jgi:hypothetical protein
MYGTREFSTNVDNVKAAAASYNDNSPDARVWWDK